MGAPRHQRQRRGPRLHRNPADRSHRCRQPHRGGRPRTPPRHLRGGAPKRVGHQSLGRVGSPAEIAEAVAWLASPASDYVQGHVLTVSGGQIGGMTW
ncbi:SDR family oxidoreductase [Mycobacterium paraintracellulare]|uniref:SDR family oxidoreductase n=1 Tax=Mycobacterium paraintracellulare TaxID=1138383 RepID=UPI002EDBB5ED